jgi:hypothetical protein
MATRQARRIKVLLERNNANSHRRKQYIGA